MKVALVVAKSENVGVNQDLNKMKMAKRSRSQGLVQSAIKYNQTLIMTFCTFSGPCNYFWRSKTGSWLGLQEGSNVYVGVTLCHSSKFPCVTNAGICVHTQVHIYFMHIT